MAKRSTVFVCTKCDAQYPAWQGRCFECGAWGTITEQVDRTKETSATVGVPVGKTISLSKVTRSEFSHKATGIPEFDRVLSGGIVDGSLTLLGGSPGIGKSTLVLQVAANIAKRGRVLYISGEESKEQLKLRYDRLQLDVPQLEVMSETDVDVIIATITKVKPLLAIVDSIQTISISDLPGEPGNVTQVKAATVRLLETAKKTGTSVILVGHVTKEGVVAGPKMLEHLVDTVLYMEGEDSQAFRLLRTAKHRFGVTDEVGVFTMTDKGLETVVNPSELFLLEHRTSEAGTAITAVVEGTRPFLVEVQALVSQTTFGYPRRLASGMDRGRVELLLAVLSKRTGVQFGMQDVHINLVGGLKVKEPAVDLAVCFAAVSGILNIPIPSDLLIVGEVGLAGEIRPVSRLEQRLSEAQKLGFRQAIVPDTKLSKKASLSLKQSHTLRSALEIVFGPNYFKKAK